MNSESSQASDPNYESMDYVDDDPEFERWLEERNPLNKVRIIQNTSDFTNDEIKYIMRFVDPLLEPEIDRFMETPLDLGIRVIYESERDNEFLDNNCLGSYIPKMYYLNKDDLVIVEKAIISIILPDCNTSFPLPSNYPVLRYAESKGLKITKKLLKELKQARMKAGNSTIILLSLKEFLIYLIAHELRHHWQYVNPYHKYTFASELEKEKDANAYAVKKLRLWRTLYGPKDAYPNTNFML